MDSNPYSAPQSDLSKRGSGIETMPLWNPNAAALWSLVFSPVFGAILHMKNWQALGRPDKAKESRTWAVMSAVILLTVMGWSAVAEEGSIVESISNFVGFAVLISWYMASGREQVNLVKNAGSYQKRGWGKPIMFGLLATVGVVAFVVVAMMIGAPAAT